MSISLLVLELWQFSFLGNSPEIWKAEIPASLSGDWGELGIPILAGMSLMKSYWMLQNSTVPFFNISVLLKEKQQGGVGGGGGGGGRALNPRSQLCQVWSL